MECGVTDGYVRPSLRLTPTVDMAQLYDGFSFLTVMWLEAMGFCEHGKVGPFPSEVVSA
jgi:hypothetical protein